MSSLVRKENAFFQIDLWGAAYPPWLAHQNLLGFSFKSYSCPTSAIRQSAIELGVPGEVARGWWYLHWPARRFRCTVCLQKHSFEHLGGCPRSAYSETVNSPGQWKRSMHPCKSRHQSLYDSPRLASRLAHHRHSANSVPNGEITDPLVLAQTGGHPVWWGGLWTHIGIC